MGRSFLVRSVTMAFVWLVSILGLAAAAHAHEVRPTIADISVSPDGMVSLALDLNLEAFLAGIDLDSVEDTDAAENAADYDALRALSADELAVRAGAVVEQWSRQGLLRAGGQAQDLMLVETDVTEEPDQDLTRETLLSLEATLPSGVGAVTVAWPDGAGALILRQQGVEDGYTGYLEGGQESPEIGTIGAGALTSWQAFVAYVPVGFDHILPKGLDHILFVLGLFFLSTQWRPLLWQVSAFTLAHTVTLALGAVGWVNVPSSIVEPLIAASIAYVAIENVIRSGLSRWRPFVIFGFGLLHGLGFASVLGEFGLPEGQFLPALLGFNVGVEIGQLTVIALAFLAVGFWSRRAWYRMAISVPASCVIAAVGIYWSVERVLL